MELPCLGLPAILFMPRDSWIIHIHTYPRLSLEYSPYTKTTINNQQSILPHSIHPSNYTIDTHITTMVSSNHTSSNPAITAYKVYHLSSVKLDREARRQTPDLARLVAHATIIDNVRRWSRTTAVPTEAVVVESDPFEDSASDEDLDSDCDVGEVAVFEFDEDESKQWSGHSQDAKTYEIHSSIVEEHGSEKNAVPAPKRRPPPPPPSTSTYDIKNQSWRQNRPVTVSETAVEVDGDD